MSLVGPRPHAPSTRAAGCLFEELVPNYHERHYVRPGITGWAQVNGWRGETRTHEDIQMRVRYDMDYIRDWSLLFDLRILLLTLARMFNDDTAV
jgi:lipopolysaccharide/colanic/teichoic acid biosynthesis glycosyltransferase